MINDNHVASTAVVKNCVLGEGARVFNNAELKDTRIGVGAIIGDQAIVLNSEVGDKVSLNRRNYILRSSIGRYSYTGIGTMIRSATVGNFCSLSWNISIGGGDHDYNHVTTSPLWRFRMMEGGEIDHKSNADLQKRFEDQADCIIGHDVWIATNVVVLRGVTIGNGAVIGAGAIVTKDVAPYSIVVGVPAREIKKRFDVKTIEALEGIQWWNWPEDVLREHIDLIWSRKMDRGVIEQLMQISKNLK